MPTPNDRQAFCAVPAPVQAKSALGELIADYKEASALAHATANATQLACGIRKAKWYGKVGYVVSFLPRSENRFGFDYTCEAVEPDRLVTPATDTRTRSA